MKLSKLPKSVSCLSVLVKLYNNCGYKVPTGICFKGANKLRKFFKKRGHRLIQDPVKCLQWIIFVKIWSKVLQERSMLDVWKDP